MWSKREETMLLQTKGAVLSETRSVAPRKKASPKKGGDESKMAAL